jgi:hypothetical protein
MATTYFLARLIGPILFVVGASVLFQRAVFLAVLNDLIGNRTALFMTGLVLLLLGLFVVLVHNVWNAGFLPLVITLLGWLLVLRGLLSMFVPGHEIARLVRVLKFEEFSWLYGSAIVVLAAYLTWAGFSG